MSLVQVPLEGVAEVVEQLLGLLQPGTNLPDLNSLVFVFVLVEVASL